MTNPLRLTTQPLSFLQYEVCTLHTALNEHSVLKLEGTIDAQHAADFLASYDKPLTLKYVCEEVELQWQGVIKDVQITHAYTSIRATVMVYSETIRLDERKETRTYTNESTLKEMCANMQHASSIAWHGKYATQSLFEPFTIQYEETNWQFLKRLASRYDIPFVLEEIAGQVEIYTNFQQEAYNVATYDYVSIRPHGATVSMLPIVSKQPIYYTGMQLTLEQTSYIIGKATYELQPLHSMHVQYELIRTYEVAEQQHPLAHTIFPATVIDTTDPQQLGRIAVCFEWENAHDVQPRFIPWATPFSAQQLGFHALPSIGEVVYVMCAGQSEQQFVAYLAERTAPHEQLTNDVQLWRTAEGTEIRLRPHELALSLQMEESHVRKLQLAHDKVAAQYDARYFVMDEQQLALTFSDTQQLTMNDEATTVTFDKGVLRIDQEQVTVMNESNQLTLTDQAAELVRKAGIVRITDDAVLLEHNGQQVELTDQHIRLVGKGKEHVVLTGEHIELQRGKERVRLSSKGVEVQASTFTVDATKIKLKGKTEITS